jgi:hypothetical protein
MVPDGIGKFSSGGGEDASIEITERDRAVGR